MRTVSMVLAALAAGLGQAQFLINELSFGIDSKLSHDESPGTIPHYHVNGQPNRPDVLSNKVILTPMGLGNQRASIWGERTLQRDDWVADIDVRANGPERASGNLNIWLAKDGRAAVQENSVYTVGRFEGLVLVIDQYGGSGGMLRGFLNDGTKDFARQTNLDSLAFGHCQISYRNHGRPSQIKVHHSGGNFKVEFDGRKCFESSKIAIPQGYTFGITAATPENPDSFEIFKLVVMSETVDPRHAQNQQQQGGNNNQNSNQQAEPGGFDNPEDAFRKAIPDESAEVFQTSTRQFADLHNRLQSTYHQLAAVYRSVTAHHAVDEQRHREVQDMVSNIRADLKRLDKVDSLQRTVESLQRDVASLRDALDRRISSHENTFRGALTDHHRLLSERMMDSIPGHGKLIFILVGTQVVLAGVYIVYKRRKMASPKKYL
ncbi:lectin family integral membrane protein, putative [Cordyceps militaris CM01]|uniref:Lectin family integral membrane protein, putative n=1 Tax=Cordyceps militaris (strain CM01) TaxID=983644 RepID=G3J5X9_CORMM|nr:lectin family integral membrane protein, putative [Cordyceps militaris CM01]EGX96931.1 lectin family integral membrane protein, putative [Cordyceps militaris CM01]